MTNSKQVRSHARHAVLAASLGFGLGLGLVIGQANAALFDRGGGLVYDDVLDITWLADANYALTVGATLPIFEGRMVWDDGTTWVAQLEYAGYSDWRLPDGLNQDGSGPCEGSGCRGSELGHMFYNNMEATAGSSILAGSNTANLALFTNIQNGPYWSGTEHPSNPAELATSFGFEIGNQCSACTKHDQIWLWPVRDGDGAPIPEPGSYAYILAGLGVVGYVIVSRRSRGQRATPP